MAAGSSPAAATPLSLAARSWACHARQLAAAAGPLGMAPQLPVPAVGLQGGSVHPAPCFDSGDSYHPATHPQGAFQGQAPGAPAAPTCIPRGVEPPPRHRQPVPRVEWVDPAAVHICTAGAEGGCTSWQEARDRPHTAWK